MAATHLQDAEGHARPRPASAAGRVPRRAASSAPASEPTAIRVLKQAVRAGAARGRRRRRRPDSQIGKLKPKVPMKPTSTIGQISSGRPAT